MTDHANTRALVPAALITLSLLALPRASHAQPNPAQPAQPVVQHQQHKDPAAMTPPGHAKREAAAAPAKPVEQPPTGAEVGTAIDAMGTTCGKALELSTQIEAAVAKRKTSLATRAKSGAELKKKLRA